ncbi:Sialic acid TRAP transporter large permease protein SiaM [bacterium HR33]|nr:Sialic acid TRAP transporter large permease protein SiaM [bacterium HR33]
MRFLIPLLAIGAAAFHLWAAGVSPFTAFVQRPVHLAFMAALGFLGVGVMKRDAEKERRGIHRAYLAISSVLIAATLFSTFYMVLEHNALVRRAGSATKLDLAAGALAILVVLELARRTTGWGLVTVALLALAYGILGPYLPGLLAHRGYSPGRLIEHLYLTTEGIWGVPLGVSADFVYLFVLFGAVLEGAGGGELLIGLASRIAGRTRAGPAKTAAVASALMGSVSGSAVANVVTTGAFTIPLMKRTGFKPHFAAAVEAAASTGGQFMPPIMGAGAFILATWTGIPYVKVALAAAIPAVLYYVALYTAIHFRAVKVGIEAQGDAPREPVLPRLHLLAPLAVIVALLALGRSPMRAAFWGVATAAVTLLLGPGRKLDWRGIVNILVSGASGTVQVAAACAAAGIVVGVASLTGLGLRISEFIVTLSGGHLPVALVLTGIGSILLGMGLPTTAAYVVLAALGAPALIELGVPVLAAHLFIFYFGCISNVTPPVALAAYAAAGLAGAPPLRTGVTAMGLAATGFLVPFMFVYGPALLLAAPVHEILLAIITASAGVVALAAAVIGHARRPVTWWERALLAAAAIGLIKPGLVTDLFGLSVMLLVFATPGAKKQRLTSAEPAAN